MSAAEAAATESGPSPGKRELTKQANRGAILAAARGVFGELGYGAAGVRDIVRRTGLASGTFYNYFPDKEAVFRALVDASAGQARARVRDARRAAQSLEDFVSGGYRAYFQFLAEDRATFELMRRNAGTIRSMFDEPMLGAGIDELRADLGAVIAAGAVPAAEVEYMAAAMVGAGFEVGVRMLERQPPDVERAAAFASAVFLGAIDRLGWRFHPAAAGRAI